MKLLLMRILFVVLSLTLYSASYASCTYCTDIEDALEKPYEVQYLDLSGQGLTKLPDSLAKFKNLIFLDLSENQIADVEFSDLGLENLESLNLNFNPGLNMINIEGIEEAMPSLRDLHLRNCSMFLISPDIGKLKKLEFLDVSNNKLRTLPSQLENCKLKEVRIRNNDLDNALWAMDLWSLKTVDVSNNKKLNLDEFGHALLFKDLKKVTVSPEDQNNLTKIFGKVSVNTLVVNGGSFDLLAKGIPMNPNIKNVVFQELEAENGPKFYSWLNLFESLETIEFTNMKLPEGISKIKNTNAIIFDLCSIERFEEVAQISPTIKLRMVNMIGESEGNAASANFEEEMPLKVNQTMINNSVPEIIAPTAFKETISAQKSEVITLENTSYAIPKNAFLTASGEVYKGDVSLEITEYNDAFSNALAGAPMVFRDGAVNQIFSSSGMLDFRAFDDQGRELLPNQENIIEVEMIDLQPGQDTRLYSFNESDSNWVDIGKAIPSDGADLRKRILDSLNQIPDEYFYTINPVKSDFAIEVKRSRNDPYEFSFMTVRSGFLPAKYGYDKSRRKDYVKTFEDETWITERRRSFQVDTVMTDDIVEILKELKKESRKRSRYYRKVSRNSRSIPPVPGTMRELELIPNFDRDNYTIKFKFRDTVVRIPVTFKVKGNIQKVQRKEKDRFIEFNRVKGKASRERMRFEKESEDRIMKGAKKLRESRADYLSSTQYSVMTDDIKRQNAIFERRQAETYRFGLATFGTVNCDYFSRTRGETFVKSVLIAEDQDGEPVQIPDDIRTVIPNENIYICTSPEAIPTWKRKKAISFFAIGLAKIAVIVGWEKLSDGFSRPIIETRSTEGKTPEEVKKMLQKF